MHSNGLQAFLLDKFLNQETPLSLFDSSFVNLSVTSNVLSKAPDRFSVIFRPMGALPVTITSLKAKEKEGDILVEWKVENELNISKYEVERSTEGNHFVKIGEVASKNLKAGEYKWLDENKVNGYNYYRLRSLDINGQASFSQVVKVLVEFSANASISVYPNPIINGVINLQLKNQVAGIYHVRILNPLGQSIMARKINYSAGDNVLETFKLGNNAASGIYVVEVISPSNKKVSIKITN